MLRITEVVKHLLIINVIVFLAMNILEGKGIFPISDYMVMYTPDTGKFMPLQIVTNMFAHANFQHILFNMLVLFFLGPMTEMGLGAKKFLALYLIAGIVGSVAQLLLSHNASILGASGATMGVTAAFAMMFPNVRLMLLFPPIPIKAKYLALIIIGIDLFSGLSGANTGIGHFAHVAGAFAGGLLVLLWGKQNLR